MTKAGDLKWGELFKSNEPASNLRKTNTEKVPAAQYHKDKPKGTLHKNAYSDTEEKDQIPAAPKNKPGEVPRRPSDAEISRVIMSNMPASMKQPTHADMVKAAIAQGIQKTPEQMEKMDKDWEGTIGDFYKNATKPIEDPVSKDNQEWGSGKSFNDDISEEELQKRNMYTEDE